MISVGSIVSLKSNYDYVSVKYGLYGSFGEVIYVSNKNEADIIFRGEYDRKFCFGVHMLRIVPVEESVLWMLEK